jgi:integrase
VARSLPGALNAHRILTACRRARPQPVSTKEFNALLSAADEDRRHGDLKDIVVILFHTGMRVSEVCELRWSDVDFEERQMLVRDRKNRRSRRVPFGQKVLQVLKARRACDLDSEFVAGNSPDRVLRKVSQQLRELSPASRRAPITLHVLRHSFMARWMAAGGGIAELGCVTGIATPTRFMKHLISPDCLYASAAKFQAKLEEQEQ